MKIKQIKQKSNLSAKRSTSLHHCSIRCTLTPNFLFALKLCYVSKYLKKNTSPQTLDTGNLRSDLPKIKLRIACSVDDFNCFSRRTKCSKRVDY